MKIAKRYLAVVLSFALFLALPLVFTQEAAAASKGTKILQPSMVVETDTDFYADGTTKTKTDYWAYAYNDKGLNSVIVDNDGYQTAMLYNKSGYMTTSAELDKDGKPYEQNVYTVKKGKRQSEAGYSINDGKTTLTGFTKYTYKSGKLSQKLYVSGNGKTSAVTTYRKDGTCSQRVSSTKDGDEEYQYIAVYDKYGNVTRETSVNKWGNYNWTELTTYQNTYKSGKLVKVVSTEARTSNYSDTQSVTTGLTVYTYKKDKLVKAVDAVSYPGNEWFPATTEGTTTDYAYTKGGLIKTISFTQVRTTATESKVTDASITAFQYKKVAVDKKCVDAVKKAMDSGAFSYKSYIPGSRA